MRFWVLLGIVLVVNAYPFEKSVQYGVTFLVLVTIAMIEIREGKLMSYPSVTKESAPGRYYSELFLAIVLAILVPCFYYGVL